MNKATIRDCVAIKETDKALLVEIDGDEQWIPKTAVHEDSEVYQEGDEGDLVLKGWFAQKIGVELD